MPGLLKIKDLNERGVLAFDIADLLTFVGEDRTQWAWRLFPMGEPTYITGANKPFGEQEVWEFGCLDRCLGGWYSSLMGTTACLRGGSTSDYLGNLHRLPGCE